MSVTKYGDAFIKGLEPYGLGRVPGCDRADPRMAEPDAEWRLAWREWRRDLAKVRVEILLAAQEDEQVRAVQRALCAKDPAYWLAIYGTVYEPRPREGEDNDKPFTPFAFQVNLLDWFLAHTASPKKYDGFVSKSRGLGGSWIFCAGAVWAWLHQPWEIHFISFREDKVYQRNDRSSLFGKIEYTIDNLPAWMQPEGFTPEEHMLRLNLYNPVTRAAITGETTTIRSTRSNRKTAIIYDEAGFIEKFPLVYSTGAGTSDHRFCISTETYEQGDDWELEWTAAKEDLPESVWELEWYDNPYQDRLWYAEEKFRHRVNPHLFAVEYERNAAASVDSLLIYPEARHCRKTEQHFDPTKSLIVAIDPGHADDTGIVWGQQIDVEGARGIRWLGSYKRNRVPVDFYAHLLTGIRPEPGDACWPMWTDGGFSERDRRLMAWFRARADAAGTGEWTRFCMDPAGKQEHAGTSFIGLFHKKTAELRQRQWERDGSHGPKPKGIWPNYKFLQEQGNLIVDRVLVTRRFLPASEFSTADPELWRAGDVQEALKRSKYSEGTPRSVSQPKPIHGEESHLRSAVEYACVYAYLGMIDPPKHVARRMLDALKRAA